MKIGWIASGMCVAAIGACASPAPGTAATATATATAQPEAPLPPLKGTRWRGIIDPAFDQSHAPWLEFVTADRISGYTGCNMLSGGWREEGGHVRLGPLVTTKRACLGPESEIERRLLAAFGADSRVAMEGRKLVVIAPDGRRAEFYEAK